VADFLPVQAMKHTPTPLLGTVVITARYGSPETAMSWMSKALGVGVDEGLLPSAMAEVDFEDLVELSRH
jgi:hypothetical protein